MRGMTHWIYRSVAGVVIGVIVLPVWGSPDPPPDYGIDFLRISAPGNRDTIPSETPIEPDWHYGAVDQVYRISRTELTVTQWAEFCNAYKDYWEGHPLSFDFVGLGMSAEFNSDGTVARYVPLDDDTKKAARVRWRMAARYVNWLNNDKRPEQSAFEDGAYDTSTFHTDGTGFAHDQLTHHADARYWIPTLNETIKAAYYDPDRYGPGLEGYWLYPDGGNEPLVEGPPGIGETWGENGGDGPGDAGAYPGVASPWGLLDVSGTGWEWTEHVRFPEEGARSRELVGSNNDLTYQWYDRLDFRDADNLAFGTVRIASAIPEPYGMFVFGIIAINRRRSR
ncbi:MAG: SUMF1/EgtB/PvdO family nonheme iron enzyme [Phycisphaeraceae bacterium]|nr:SUMF1/EgtB/PvdO family nonheme iron enzyme [Phycisphaeraceae bacterium]MBX3367985.1 SUMF1/EgtB/PvdO family nonheme iron enzyme [Phycisphaeraceae bacterium]